MDAKQMFKASSGENRLEGATKPIGGIHALGLDHDVGSMQSGKLADFAVLDADLTEVPVDQLQDSKVWGVVFEGAVHQAYIKPLVSGSQN